MPGLTIHTGNRLETLADRLAQIVRKPQASTLQPEFVVVQSRGMERWLSLALARRNGVSANMAFPFPNVFLQSLFRRLFSEIPDPTPFEPDTLTFRIIGRLPALLDRPEFSGLKGYLGDDHRGLKIYQLALRLADLFDQYLVFRPDMIFRWEAGRQDTDSDSRWQAQLWRDLTRGHEDLHRAGLHKKLLERLDTVTLENVDGLPSRVSLFGISYLPPFYLQAFAGLARIMPVHLFLLNPCREYWADILNASEMHKLTRRVSGIAGAAVERLHMEQGHPLLASMGQMGRDFFALISEYEAHIEEEFQAGQGGGLLSCIQDDILHLSEQRTGLPAEGGAANAAILASDGQREAVVDGSIQIHACHSPMREIEVLYDRLLAIFEEEPDLQPQDIVVMAPDIESYAPYIHAVFDRQEGTSQAIPFSVADRPARIQNHALQCLLSLLDLRDSRFGASRLLGLLEHAGIRQRFGLTLNDLEIIERWVQEVNIRWGRDAAGKTRHGLPGLAENTWQAGIDRLLLGYAMPLKEQDLFAGILPYDHIEGSESQILGRFLTFLQQVFTWSARLEKNRAVSQWCQTLTALLEDFVALDENASHETQSLRRILEEFGRLALSAEFSAPVDLEIVRHHISKRMDDAGSANGFISRGVTFGAMLPMRSIPFEVICLVGMNSDAYPRNDTPLGFDLMARNPKRGDRSRRMDDKYLFLEALVSARRRLYISYVGQSVQDNSIIPPSVLVSELVETVERRFGIGEAELLVRHPLQAYSRRYFDDGEKALFSYSKDNYAAAVKSVAHAARKVPFFTGPLSGPSADWHDLRLEHLCRYCAHPARFLIQRRLGIRLEEGAAMPEDREDFSLNALKRHRIGQEMVDSRLRGLDRRAFYRLQKAKGDLPQGTIGKVVYRDIEKTVEDLLVKIESITGEQPGATRAFDLDVFGVRLGGDLDGLYPAGRVQARFARRKAADWLQAWLYHLVMCATKSAGRPNTTILIGTDGAARIRPVEQPIDILAVFVDFFGKGLRQPPAFIPDLSMLFVRQVLERGKTAGEALTSVRRQWTGSDYRVGMSTDPYYRLCFEHEDPFDERFVELAETVFAPLLRHAEEMP